jgi:hypothetical protein
MPRSVEGGLFPAVFVMLESRPDSAIIIAVAMTAEVGSKPTATHC